MLNNFVNNEESKAALKYSQDVKNKCKFTFFLGLLQMVNWNANLQACTCICICAYIDSLCYAYLWIIIIEKNQFYVNNNTKNGSPYGHQIIEDLRLLTKELDDWWGHKKA